MTSGISIVVFLPTSINRADVCIHNRDLDNILRIIAIVRRGREGDCGLALIVGEDLWDELARFP